MKAKKLIQLLPCLLLLSCNNGDHADLDASHSRARYQGPIIDMHLHAYGNTANMMFGMTHPPTLRGETYRGAASAQEQKVKSLEYVEKYNIVKAVVADGQYWADEKSDKLLLGDGKKSIDQLREMHAKGELDVIAEVASFYNGLRADDESVLPYFGLAQELGIPIGYHIFPGGPNYGFHLMPNFLGGVRAKNANPIQIEEALVKYPKAKVYIMHGAWPYVDDLKALMYAHPNLYIDVAATNWIIPQKEFDKFVLELIDAGFGDRIMYGTDQMVWPELIGVGIETINSSKVLSLKQKEDIFYNNAARFLGLSPEEIAAHKGEE